MNNFFPLFPMGNLTIYNIKKVWFRLKYGKIKVKIYKTFVSSWREKFLNYFFNQLKTDLLRPVPILQDVLQ